MDRLARAPLSALLFALALSLAPSTGSALTMTPIGLGLDVGNVCLDSAASCSAEATFTLGGTVATSGTFTYTPSGGGFGSMAIELDLDDFSMTGTGPDGVEEIVFTNVHISVLAWNTFEVGPVIQGLGGVSASITGSYEQLDGGGGTVVGPSPLDQSATATALGCPVSGVGQCGFSLVARDFEISVGTGNAETHDIAWTFNVQVVPEPTTALLLGAGLGLTALRRRMVRRA